MLNSFNAQYNILYHATENTAKQENCFIFDGVTVNPLIIHRAYVTLIVSVTGFPMAWYEIVIQRSLVVCHEIS